MSLLIPEIAEPVAQPVFELSSYAEATALVEHDDRLTYADLNERASRFAAEHYGPGRRLVLIEAANDLDTVVAYLAALNHGHVALMTPPGHDQSDLLANYDPDVVVAAEVTQRRDGSAHELHPDLALLLSTSGSTGSPKLVRLSRENLISNAEAIAEYLDLRGDDRAITSLPLHYCYGLSILHSHLVRGAALVLTDLSVLDECFWTLCVREAVTTVSGVPYTFELLNHSGFAGRDVPSLRRVTQAGGKLRRAEVRRYAELCRSKGADFYVMYGQTEATARMAYLPPDLAATRPEAAGIAIPGGHLRIDAEGEVVYSGPNVMLGYAHTAADLARPRDIHELHTGDLGEIRDGLLHIVGRRNRCAKIFGLRIDLDRLEGQLSRSAHVVAGPDSLTVLGTHEEMPCLAAEIATVCHLPTSAVRWQRIDTIPLKANGKPDLQALADLVVTEETTATNVRGHFAVALGAVPAPEDTFTSMGGDSLSYVELATRLESCLPGGLPADWHRRSVYELSRMASSQPRRHLVRQDPTISLRALAILIIIGSHVELFDIMGGAHVLLAVAGFNFARFTMSSAPEGRLRRSLASLAAIVVPTTLWICAVAVISGKYQWPTALYLNGFVGAERWNDNWQFWFMEALIWPTLALAVLLAWRRAAEVERGHPFGFALGLLAATAAIRFALVGVQADALERYQVPGTAFFFALGWIGARAGTLRERLLVSALTLVLVPGFFDMPQREAVIVTGILAFVWLPTITLPRALGRVTSHLATYSLCIYVTHWIVYPPLEVDHPVLAVLACVAVGSAYGSLMLPVQRRVSQIIRGTGETAYPKNALRP